MIQSVGVDIGAQKTVILADDGERVLTSTGSQTRPSIVLFGNSRLVGEEAAPELMHDGIIPFINTLIGKSLSDIQQQDFIPHTKLQLVEACPGVAGVQVSCGESQVTHSLTSVLGVYLGQMAQEISDANLVDKTKSLPTLAFPLPHGYTPSMERAVREACAIAGLTPLPEGSAEGVETSRQTAGVYVVDSARCLARAYSRKLSAIKPPEKSFLENEPVLIVEMGHMHATAVVVRVDSDLQTAVVERVEHSASIGAHYFDLALFTHLAAQIEQKHGCQIVPGSKRGLRLLRSCEKLRKLLSQLPTSSVTVENMTDAGDVTVSMTRDDMSRVCAEQLNNFKELLGRALEGVQVVAVEVAGGGVRMQVVQDAILASLGKELPLGAKLDDGSVAVGAALLANEATSSATTGSASSEATESDATADAEPTSLSTDESNGLSTEQLVVARVAELAMQKKDNEIRELQSCRNEMEAYILDMRGAPKRKHGETIDNNALTDTLNEYENWLWDNGETASLDEIRSKYSALQVVLEGTEVAGEGEGAPVKREGGLCSSYLAATADDKLRLEQTLAADAAAAAAQKEAEGGEDEDHDFRKLKKADRMRLVTKNKEEGTELFKGGNIRPAAARYQKALTHAAKFFDLSPEDKEEVNQVKLSIFLNLTQCYLKLENYDNAIRYSTDALEISPTSVKAYFRRSAAYEAKKDYDKAFEDIKKASEHSPTEDKAVVKAMERVKRLIQKEKEKEKKMWGKAFS